MATAWCDGRHVIVTGERSVRVVPGDQIRVLCAGVETRGMFYACPGDPILVQAISVQPEARFAVRLSPDGMRAEVCVLRRGGVEREVAPAKPANPLFLQTVVVRELPPPPVHVGEVLMALADLGVQVPVDQPALAAACAAGTGEWIPVATGIEPVPPAAVRPRRTVPLFVSAGEPAFYLDRDPGKPGRTVTGKPVAPGAGRGQLITAVTPTLTRTADSYLAAVDGYPWTAGPFYGLTPFTEPHRLEPHTLVRRQMAVSGILFVDGDLIGCDVTCGGLVCSGTILQSRVTVTPAAPVLTAEQLERDLGRLEQAVTQIVQHPDTADVPVARLIAVLLRTRLRAIPEAAAALPLSPALPFAAAWQALTKPLADWLVDGGSLLLVRSTQAMLRSLIAAWAQYAGGILRAEAVVDSRISGPWLVSAATVQRSVVTASRRIAAGQISGGRCFGALEIQAETIGDARRTPTLVEAAADGWIRARQTYPGAVLRAGDRPVSPVSIPPAVHLTGEGAVG